MPCSLPTTVFSPSCTCWWDSSSTKPVTDTHKAQKTNKNSDDPLAQAARYQREQEQALESLAPDGLLVYSTCSLEREENEDVVAACSGKLVRTMRRTPGVDPGDGFFAAVLRR